MSRKAVLAATVSCLILALSPRLARADFSKGSSHVELFAGEWYPGGGHDGPVGGFRLGYAFADSADVEASVGNYDKDHVRVTFLDLPLHYVVRPFRASTFLVGFGPGWAWAETTGSSWHARADTFTLNLEVGGKFMLTDRFYLHPAARARWYDKASNNDTDWEGTLGFGWQFGGSGKKK